MRKDTDIISFDLYTGGAETLDVSGFFPVSPLHAIRVQKPPIDTLSRTSPREIDLSMPPIFSIAPLRQYDMLDIALPAYAQRRGLALSPDGSAGGTIDLFPPIYPPYGALDVRGEPILSEQRYADLYRRSLPWSLHARRIAREGVRTLRRKRRAITRTLALAVVLTLPTIFYTKYLIESGYASLEDIKNATTQSEVVDHIHRARGHFERANILFMPFRIIPGDSVRLASIALYGGLSLTRGLDTVARDLPLVSTGAVVTDALDLANPYRPTAKNISPLQMLGISEPTTWLREHSDTVAYLRDALSRAGELYAQAGDISHPRAAEMAHIGRGLVEISRVISWYTENSSDVLALMGADTPERYIIFNQNRDEIRANGGFPGSVITFTLFRGNIEDYRTDDVYYYDWNLYPYKELPPPGLALISGNYGLRDVNYYADFRETLEKANTFIERSGDPTVTVGIALHQGIIEDILGVIGPVSLSGVTEPFSRENFSLLMSTLVEARYGEETSAKDILRRFVDAFVHTVHEKRAYEEVVSTLRKALTDGEILFASRSERLDAFLSKYKKPLPWENTSHITLSGDADISTGVTMSPNWAYPLFTSIGGNKSDRYIERAYTAETTTVGQCQYMNKLSFSHKHTYTKDIERQVRSYLTDMGIGDVSSVSKMLAIQGNSTNKTFVRLLLPKTATLTGVTAGVEVSDTPSAREFAFTLETPVGSSTSKILRYTVDIPGCQPTLSYPVLWYRQPGLTRLTLDSR